jgi:hypothetical protein
MRHAPAQLRRATAPHRLRLLAAATRSQTGAAIRHTPVTQRRFASTITSCRGIHD